jgi:hypothetical protein
MKPISYEKEVDIIALLKKTDEQQRSSKCCWFVTVYGE